MPRLSTGPAAIRDLTVRDDVGHQIGSAVLACEVLDDHADLALSHPSMSNGLSAPSPGQFSSAHGLVDYGDLVGRALATSARLLVGADGARLVNTSRVGARCGRRRRAAAEHARRSIAARRGEARRGPADAMASVLRQCVADRQADQRQRRRRRTCSGRLTTSADETSTTSVGVRPRLRSAELRAAAVCRCRGDPCVRSSTTERPLDMNAVRRRRARDPGSNESAERQYGVARTDGGHLPARRGRAVLDRTGVRRPVRRSTLEQLRATRGTRCPT